MIGITGQVDETSIAFFHTRLAEWFSKNARRFPWRETSDPYAVLMAELMLQRTQAAQVAKVYQKFIQQFPTITELARAPESEVSAALYSLGLAWRQKNFQSVAETIVQYRAGHIPEDSQQLLELPGVGDYVKSAVRCLAFGQSEVLIDTNTVRVAGRYFGFETGPESRRNNQVRAAVALLIDTTSPRQSNLALLDFAALICTARTPRCLECPVREHCRSYRPESPVSQGLQ